MTPSTPARPTSAELWAWRDEALDPPPVDVSAEQVTAVLVAHNGAAWLEQTLESLHTLDPRPTHFIGVDADSDDRSGELLRRSGLFTRVIQTEADGFGAAIAEALYQFDPHQQAGSEQRGGRWFWFLHDDCTVTADTLGALLRQGVTEPDTGILGPKIQQHGRSVGPPRLASVGQSISGSALIDPGVDEGEIDQHQHRSADALAVDSCGLLVRREVFLDLQGFSPELPVFTDGLDLGWRATERGHTVRTCPEAVLVHRQAGRNGQRSSRVIGTRPGATLRRMAMTTVAGHRHGVGALVGSIGLLLGSLLRALGFLLAKAPSRSVDELQAIGGFLGGGPVRSLRSRTSAGDRTVRQRIRRLRPGPFAGLAQAYDLVAGGVTDRWQDTFGNRGEPSLDELTGDDYSGTEHRRRRWFSPIWLTFALAVIAALIAARGLIGPGRLAGPQLLPSQQTLSDAYAVATAPIAGAADLFAPPWLAWVAIGSTLTAGQPEALITIVLLGSVPLTFLTAQVWLRGSTNRIGLRALAGALYALVPVLLGAINRGALGVVVVALVLPLVAAAIRSLLTHPTRGPESWRPAWATGLALTLFLPFLPLALPFVIIALLTAGFIDGARRVRRTLVAVAIPVVLLLPWWLSLLLTAPGRWFVGPDAALGGIDIIPAWHHWIGRSAGESLPEVWVSAVFFGLLWLGALAGLLIAYRRAEAWTGWAIAGAAGLVAVLLSRTVHAVLPVGTQVRPDVSAWLVLMAAGLIAAALTAADEAGPQRRRAAARGWRPALVLGVILTLGAATWWGAFGAAGPITREPATALPPFVVNSQTGPAKTRTLAIDVRGEQPTFQLVEGAGTRLGDPERGMAHEGSAEWPGLTRAVVASMVTGAADESVGQLLQELAIGHVFVIGADDSERTRISNTPGLGPSSGEDDWLVWTVPATAGRAVVVQGDPAAGGSITPVALDGQRRGQLELADPGQSRTLHLSEPADARWQVEVGGAPVPGRTEGQRQVYDLPPAVGALTIELRPVVPLWVSWVQLVLVIVVVVLALPSLAGAQARRRTAQESAVAPARAAGGRAAGARSAGMRAGGARDAGARAASAPSTGAAAAAAPRRAAGPVEPENTSDTGEPS